MFIKSLTVNNCQSPGKDWWEQVASTPDEHLIDATINLQLTHREYQELLQKDANNRTDGWSWKQVPQRDEM